MATKTSTAPSSSDHSAAPRIPDAHALDARRGDAADRAGSPVRERLVHPLRPAERRPARLPHGVPTTAGPRTTAAANPPSPARLPLAAAPAAQTLRDLVPPTSLSEGSGDLLGLPDFGRFARALRAGWAWFVGQVRASSEVDARLRRRREEDSALMARAGVIPGRLM